jgi:hypothetical protein
LNILINSNYWFRAGEENIKICNFGCFLWALYLGSHIRGRILNDGFFPFQNRVITRLLGSKSDETAGSPRKFYIEDAHDLG